MNVLKKILAGIGITAALLCALIVLCAVNPDVSKKLSGLVSGKRTEENAGSVVEGQNLILIPAVQEAVPDMEANDDDTEDMSEEIQPELSGSQSVTISGPSGSAGKSPSEDIVRGTNGYEPPSTTNVAVPEAVSGKSGYEPITEKSEELPDAEGGEYTSTLGYGETGDNLTFDPAFYPYYYMLDAKGQHIYRQVVANAMAMNGAFVPVEAVPVQEIRDIICAVFNDHPEMFWLNTAFVCKYDKNKICAELELDFNLKKEEFADASTQFYNTMNNMLLQVQNLSGDYDKEKAVHDMLIDKITYNKSASKNQSVYSAVVDGESVCAGYARAFQYMLQMLGIPCYYCTGYAGEAHAWNIVMLDDGYYNVDVTWDDTPEGEYDYFNKTDEDYADTHVRQELSINLPICNGQKYRQ